MLAPPGDARLHRAVDVALVDEPRVLRDHFACELHRAVEHVAVGYAGRHQGAAAAAVRVRVGARQAVGRRENVERLVVRVARHPGGGGGGGGEGVGARGGGGGGGEGVGARGGGRWRALAAGHVPVGGERQLVVGEQPEARRVADERRRHHIAERRVPLARVAIARRRHQRCRRTAPRRRHVAVAVVAADDVRQRQRSVCVDARRQR